MTSAEYCSVFTSAKPNAALGTAREDVFGALDDLIVAYPPITDEACVELSETLVVARDELLPGMSDADIIATVQDYLGRRLLVSLVQVG